MNAALCLLGYGAALAWLSPPLLNKITRDGTSPRLAISVWLSAIGLALGAWVVVGVGLALDVATGHPDGGAVEYCMEMVSALHRLGTVGHLVVVGAGVLALVLSAIVLRRIMLALRRFWLRSRDHAHDAGMVGSRTHDVIVVTSDRPAAYCVAGTPDAIVVTTGALASLDEAELAAVLAHERAHLAGRHLQLMMLLRALATSMPRLPLFRAAVDAVGRLVEMRADDSSMSKHGREALLGGLVALAGRSPVVGNVLAAGDTAAAARALRLATPRHWAARLRQRALLTATLVALFGAPVVVGVVCHS